MTEAPLVTVIIPVLDRAGPLGECLGALRAQTWPASRMEIIVVDNGSADGSAEVARQAGARVVTESRRGAGAARNRGLTEARGDLIAFTDSDCVPAPEWLAALAEAFAGDERLGFAGGPLPPSDTSDPLARYITERGLMNPERFLQPGDFSFPFFMTANVMFRRRALEAVGGFDPDLAVAGEDADLCWRVAWQDYTWQYVPRAIVHHHHRTSLAGFRGQCFRYGLGTVDLYCKHRERFARPQPIDWARYRAVAGLLRRVCLPWPSSDRATRHHERLDFIGLCSFCAGRIAGSFRRKTWFL